MGGGKLLGIRSDRYMNALFYPKEIRAVIGVAQRCECSYKSNKIVLINTTMSLFHSKPGKFLSNFGTNILRILLQTLSLGFISIDKPVRIA